MIKRRGVSLGVMLLVTLAVFSFIYFIDFGQSAEDVGVTGTCACEYMGNGMVITSNLCKTSYVATCNEYVSNGCSCVYTPTECTEPCSGFSNNCDTTGTRCGGQTCTRTAPVSGACGTVTSCVNNNNCAGSPVSGTSIPLDKSYKDCDGSTCMCSSSNWVQNNVCDCDADSALCISSTCGTQNQFIPATYSYTGHNVCCGDDSGEGEGVYAKDFLVGDATASNPCGTLDSSISGGKCSLGLAY